MKLVEIILGIMASESRWIRRTGKIASRSEVWKHLKVDRDNPKSIKCDYCETKFYYTRRTLEKTTYHESL